MTCTHSRALRIEIRGSSSSPPRTRRGHWPRSSNTRTRAKKTWPRCDITRTRAPPAAHTRTLNARTWRHRHVCTHRRCCIPCVYPAVPCLRTPSIILASGKNIVLPFFLSRKCVLLMEILCGILDIFCVICKICNFILLILYSSMYFCNTKS